MNHAIKPISSIIIIVRERSFVSFVLIALIDWGRKANVVKHAANRPSKRIKVSKLLYLKLNVQPRLV
jgi:hypothetical protein